MTQCAYCEADNGVYDFGRDCCLTRWILSAPTRQIRAMNLEYLGKRISQDRVDRIKADVEIAWKQRRDNALNFGRDKHEIK